MAMPPEHLHQSRDNNKSDTNMLEVSMMKASRAAPTIPAPTATNGNGYGVQVCGKTVCSSAGSNNGKHNNIHVSLTNGSGNDHSTKANNITRKSLAWSCPKSTLSKPTSPESSSHENHSNSNGTDVNEDSKNASTQHRGLISTANPQNTKEIYYPSRPSREDVLQRLSEALLRRSLHKIDLSQRSLQASDAKLVKMALAQNANLTVLKLGYNNLGDAGVTTLASGIVAHKSLNQLDLGFNNIGDEGIRALALSMQEASDERRCNILPTNKDSKGDISNGISTLHTLYLAGNLIGEDGAIAIADFLRRGSRLRKLFLTGNRIGGEGVKAITEAILEQQELVNDHASSDESCIDQKSFARDNNLEIPPAAADSITDCTNKAQEKQSTKQAGTSSPRISLSQNGTIDTKNSLKRKFHGMQELYLGGTGMEYVGCQALSRLLEKSSHLRVLSLPNCEIGDEEVRMLALSIKSNKELLPIESLQLSFNNITHIGLEAVANALWGSTTLRELKVDNNVIGDRGAHQIAAIIPAMKSMEVLDVGFNSITAPGLTVLMKTIAESKSLLSLSLSGNAIDANAAKSVAYALAYNCSLKALFLVHCSVGHEDQRHITAGIVSNSRTALDRLNGFDIGPVLLTLGFPEALKNWTNEQVFNFIHLMWDKNDESEDFQSDLERDLDPLSFLSNPMGSKKHRRSGPLEASVVVEVAKRYYESLVANGINVIPRRGSNLNQQSIGSPLATDAIITESSIDGVTENPTMYENGDASELRHELGVRSFVAPPESPTKKKQEMKDPNRKKRIVEWLCSNAQPLKELAKIPFDSSELWKLHQFYFTPVVKESGGSPSRQDKESDLIISSVPEVHRMNQNRLKFMSAAESTNDRQFVPVSDPAICGPSSTSTLLKRKVSYRTLGDAVSNAELKLHTPTTNGNSVARIIENGHTGHSLPPKTKRARRNRTRISFLPRIKAKLDSCLDIDHEKALVIMRQLHFVEQAILSGKVNPLESDSTAQCHLSGTSAAEAEMIIVDMM